MTNFTCNSVVPYSFGGGMPSEVMTMQAPDSVPEVRHLVDQVARQVFPVIATIAAPYVYEGVARLPNAIQTGTRMIRDGISSIGDAWSEYLQDCRVRGAARSGNNELLRNILATAQISNLQRGRALFLAYSELDRLVKRSTPDYMSASYEEIERGEEAVNALHQRYSLITTQLLDNGGIELSDENRTALFKYAVEFGNVRLVRAMLDGGPISQEVKISAINLSVYLHRSSVPTPYVEIVRLLRNDVPAEALAEALDLGSWNTPRMIAALQGREYHEAPAYQVTLPEEDQVGRFYVVPEQLAMSPQAYLTNIAENGLKPVTFMNPDGSQQQGLDAGGLTKQFICQLVESLITREVIKTDELRIPCSGQENLTAYVQFGKLLSHLERANQDRTDKLYIGEIFSQKAYELLQFLLKPQDPSESSEVRKERELIAIANAAVTTHTRELVDFLNKESPTDADIASLKEYFRVLMIDESFEAIPPEGLIAALKRQCFDSLGLESYHKTLSAIISGLSPSLKALILTQGPAIERQLQGEINDRLLDKLVSTSANAVVQEKLGWIKEKIILELEDPSKKWIKRFLKSITSQAVMPAQNIQVRESSDNMCRAHTCFCYLDLPKDNTTKQMFFERLELMMGEVGFGAT